MSIKVSIWKVTITFLLVAVLIIGGFLIYRVGYVRGAASNWSLREGHDFPGFHHYKDNFKFYPFDGRLMVSRLFPGLFLGMLCLGILLIMVAVMSIGAARRHLFWEKNSLFDPTNLWEPPPSPERRRKRDDKVDTFSE